MVNYRMRQEMMTRWVEVIRYTTSFYLVCFFSFSYYRRSLVFHSFTRALRSGLGINYEDLPGVGRETGLPVSKRLGMFFCDNDYEFLNYGR